MSGELYGFDIGCEACGEEHQKLRVWESVGGTLRVTCQNHPKPFNVFSEALARCLEDREAAVARTASINPEDFPDVDPDNPHGAPDQWGDADKKYTQEDLDRTVYYESDDAWKSGWRKGWRESYAEGQAVIAKAIAQLKQETAS